MSDLVCVPDNRLVGVEGDHESECEGRDAPVHVGVLCVHQQVQPPLSARQSKPPHPLHSQLKLRILFRGKLW